MFFFALRPRGPDFSILSMAPRTSTFPLQSPSKMIVTGSAASRTRFLYSEHASRDANLLFTKPIQIDGFWLWDLECHISLLWALPQDIDFFFSKVHQHFWFLALRPRGPYFSGLSKAHRTSTFALQSLSKFMISGSETSRSGFLYSEHVYQLSLYKGYTNW